MNPLELGFLGEIFLSSILKSRGIQVSESVSYYGDLIANGVYIEVKTIRKSGNEYAATIRKDNSQHLVYADFLVILIIENDFIYPYIIPTNKIETHIKRIHISSHPKKYQGKYNEFYNAWSLLFSKLASNSCVSHL